MSTKISAGPGAYLDGRGKILPRRMSVYSLKSYFSSSIDLCIPAWLEILKGCGIYNDRFGRISIPEQKIIPERTEKLPTSFAVCANLKPRATSPCHRSQNLFFSYTQYSSPCRSFSSTQPCPWVVKEYIS